MVRGKKIVLTTHEKAMMNAFVNNIDTRSQATRDHMASMFKTFANEVDVGAKYSQEEISTWMRKHEHKNPNDNCRHFLISFGNFLLTLKDVKSNDIAPLFSRKIKTLQPPKNRKIPTGEDFIYLLEACKQLDSGFTTPILFNFYLRLVWEGGLRKSEPLKITLRDIKKENDIARVLIRGKGNRQRWVVISLDLYSDITDYHNRLRIVDGEFDIFKLDVKKVDDIYIQVCRAANKLTNSENFAKVKGYAHKIRDVHGNAIGARTNTYLVPIFSLHKFRTARATEWDKQGLSMVITQRRLGHQSVATTQRYIDHEEQEMIKQWAEEKPINEDIRRCADAIEEERQKLIAIRNSAVTPE